MGIRNILNIEISHELSSLLEIEIINPMMQSIFEIRNGVDDDGNPLPTSVSQLGEIDKQALTMYVFRKMADTIELQLKNGDV